MKCPSCNFSFSHLRDICPRCLLDVRPVKERQGMPIANPGLSYEALVIKLGKQPRPRVLEEPAALPQSPPLHPPQSVINNQSLPSTPVSPLTAAPSSETLATPVLETSKPATPASVDGAEFDQHEPYDAASIDDWNPVPEAPADHVTKGPPIPPPPQATDSAYRPFQEQGEGPLTEEPDDPFALFGNLESLSETTDGIQRGTAAAESPPILSADLLSLFSHEDAEIAAATETSGGNFAASLFSGLEDLGEDLIQAHASGAVQEEVMVAASLQFGVLQTVTDQEEQEAPQTQAAADETLDPEDEAAIENLLSQLEMSVPVVPSILPDYSAQLLGKSHTPLEDDHEVSTSGSVNTQYLEPDSEFHPDENVDLPSESVPPLLEDIGSLFARAAHEVVDATTDFELSLFHLDKRQPSEMIELYFELAAEALINPEAELQYVDLAALVSSKRDLNSQALSDEARATESSLATIKHQKRQAALADALPLWEKQTTVPASLRGRLVAFAIDLAFGMVLSLVIGAWITVSEHPWLLDIANIYAAPPTSTLITWGCTTLALLPFACIILDFVGMLLLHRTLGMRLCGLTVVRADGGPISVLHILVRVATGPLTFLNAKIFGRLLRGSPGSDPVSRTRVIRVMAPPPPSTRPDSSLDKDGSSEPPPPAPEAPTIGPDSHMGEYLHSTPV